MASVLTRDRKEKTYRHMREGLVKIPVKTKTEVGVRVHKPKDARDC